MFYKYFQYKNTLHNNLLILYNTNILIHIILHKYKMYVNKIFLSTTIPMNNCNHTEHFRYSKNHYYIIFFFKF